ncbi:MAG: hypothetical protein FJW21_02430 [Acidimicrobiia bacterium]|nr:hypothetical protein [Acidimicrobiia bacterium]
MTYSRQRLIGLIVALGLAAVGASSNGRVAGGALPQSLSDTAYWELVERLSEPDGYFQSDNLVSNEHSFQYVVPALEKRRRPNQVYLGVAPDQNFTYIPAMRPAMAFIVDIRRGNLLTHLMYKALFDLSEDRADFVAFLFSRPRPEGLTATSSVDEILAAVAGTPGDEVEFRNNLLIIQQYLTKTRGFTLSADDLRGLDDIYSQFYEHGPQLSYSSRARAGGVGGVGGRRGVGNRFPTWGEMARQTDGDGRQQGYLASDENFRYIKDLHARNLIVPVVGDHTGPKALRDVGRYIRQHGATVGAFYTSNVEQYLFRYGTWMRFAANLGTLPLTDASVIIRSVSPRDGYVGMPQGPDGRASVLDSIRPLVRDAGAGRIQGYWDVTGRSR